MKDKPAKEIRKNRANHGLKPRDMTPEQRKNWERVNKEKK